MGGFATGFLGQVGDTVKKKADEAHDASIAQKKAQSDIYWSVIKNPDSTPEQINYAHDQLGKLYPKDPQIKQLFDKFRGLIQQTHPGHQAAAAAQGDVPPKGEPDAPPAQGNGPIPAPPQPPGAAAAPTATGTIATPPFNPSAKSAIPPPPKPQELGLGHPGSVAPTPLPLGKPPKGGSDPRFAEMAHAAGSTAGAEDKARTEWNRQEAVKHQYKMEEQEAAAKAKAANPTGAARATSPTSLSRAKELAKSGVTFKSADPAYADEDGNINVDELPEDMMLVPLQQNGHLVGYIPASQKQKVVRWDGKVHAVPEFDLTKEGEGTVKGLANPGSVTATKDPATGQTTTSVKTPIIPGAAGGVATTPAAKPSTTPAATPPGKSAPIAKSAPSTGPSTPSASAPTQPTPRGLPPLDADGHIPAAAPYAPQVIAGANDLLEGRSVKEMSGTPKTKGLSEQLARKYGWEQGLFTPKEKMQLGESSHFIDKFAASDSLSTLEEGNFHRARISQILAGSKEQGATGTLGTIFASDTDDPKVKEFVDLYNQTVQTIAGMRQITSPGRATEAAIQRLLADLPNPKTTNSVKDAHRKLGLMQEEIAYALKFGKWKDPGAEGTNRKSSIAAPPKPGGSSGGTVHWTRDAQGNPVPSTSPAP